MWEHYHWADVFLLPTLSEGSANVCWEAAATHTQVMTTAAAGLVDFNATIVPLEPDAIVARAGAQSKSPEFWRPTPLRNIAD